MIHHHEFWWRFFPKKELNQIYVSVAVRAFAISLIGIFIPLYLHLDQGYSLQETLLFFVFYSVIFAIMTPLAAKFAATFGVKHSVLLGMPFYLAFVVLLYTLPYFKIPLIIIAALIGISQAFYWMGLHLAFHHASDHQHRGEEFGKRASVTVIGGMFGPLLGGVLITLVGFQVLFGLVSLLLLIAAIILFGSKENHTKYHFSVRSVINKKHWKNSLFFVSEGTRVITNGVIWPLFIFIILGSYLSIGIVGSLLSGVSAILLWVVGKYSDRCDKRKIIRWGTYFDSLSWFLRAFVITPLQVFLVTILSALTTGVRESPLGALQYDKAKGEIAAYFVSREVFICLGRILMLVLVLMIDNLSGGLFFQSIANLASLLF